ncbi:MAG: hypothetical protein IPM02_28200 [Betaproteobacteria bacterium]|nr:hypothetical protein [Betaproteobacteria bacterium]
MNNALSRLLLTCLLAVALPLKGLAASSMLACGPNHHADTAAVAHARRRPGRTHAHDTQWRRHLAHDHEHGDGAAHDHAAGQYAGSGSELSASQPGTATAADQAPDLKDKSKCGTCAPCCVSAALTGDQSLSSPAGQQRGLSRVRRRSLLPSRRPPRPAAPQLPRLTAAPTLHARPHWRAACARSPRSSTSRRGFVRADHAT